MATLAFVWESNQLQKHLCSLIVKQLLQKCKLRLTEKTVDDILLVMMEFHGTFVETGNNV